MAKSCHSDSGADQNNRVRIKTHDSHTRRLVVMPEPSTQAPTVTERPVHEMVRGAAALPD